MAAVIWHEEGFYSIKTLAHNNHNPGNLREWGNTSVSEGYCVFPKIIDGATAALTDVYENRGMRVGEFLKKYAPPNENKTAAYIADVCLKTGFSPDEIIDPDVS